MLEPAVLKVVSKRKKIKIKSCGLLLNKDFPIFGASPDGITPDYVVEVKCPTKDRTVTSYITDGVMKPKFFAQIQLQMLFCKKNKGLFCVASPNFETNSEVTILEVEFDEDFCKKIMDRASEFWEKAIFPQLMKDI